MARLEKIVIQGFKSFKRNVSISFPTGFSVITGPNGSGKSNVGDSISFVIGRASSRVMIERTVIDATAIRARLRPLVEAHVLPA